MCLEIGCGKGKFMCDMAQAYPGRMVIGIEGQESVIVRAAEKIRDAGLWNTYLVSSYVRDIRDYFEDGELDRIYLNFSDPWPKKRHYKRRLTWRGRLSEYVWALKEGGFMEIKTDNDDLFDFTLEEIAACGWRPAELSRDLHSSDYEARNTVTEYEKKFMGTGKNINYVKVLPR